MNPIRKTAAPGRRLALGAALAAFVVLTGCATSAGFAKPDMDPKNWGDPPADYEQRIRAHFDTFLKDGPSARYKFEAPVRAYANQGLIYGGGVRWVGYLVKVEVNAKNSFGGYVGWKPYMAMLSKDGVYQVMEGSSHPVVHVVY